jgi:serpin B
MRPVYLSTLLSIFGFLGVGHASAAPPEGGVPAVVEAGNQFAVDLYRQLDKEQPGKNLFYSPVSLTMALGMTAAGARGETEAEMARTLHLAGILPQAHAGYQKLLRHWNTEDKTRGYQLRLANRLWGQSGYPFLPRYLTLTRQQYGAKLEPADFAGQTEAARRQINAWVEKQTAQKIKDLIPDGVLSTETRLVLANAIYFKGDWASKFDAQATHDQDFTVSDGVTVKVPLMWQGHREYPYAEDSAVQVVELGYKGGDLAMLVVLPRARDGLAAVEQSLSAQRIGQWRSRLRAREVEVSLPKFQIEAFFSLKPAMEALGMKRAFAPDADFSAMAGTDRGDLFLHAVLHKAMVTVSEEGTEAAGASAVEPAQSLPPDMATFYADHPFLFAICDMRNGSILFLGRLVRPK